MYIIKYLDDFFVNFFSFLKRVSYRRNLYILLCIVIIVMNYIHVLPTRKAEELVLDSYKVVSNQVQDVISIPGAFKEKLYNFWDTYLQNVELREQNEQYKRLILEYQQTEIQNRELKKLLNYAENTGYRYRTSRVISASANNFHHKYLLSSGINSGVRKNNAVINNEGIIGKVIDVTKNTANILLITDVTSNIPVVANISREKAIAVGNNSPLLELKYLPENSKIQDGEVLVSAGESNVFPPGILLGVVSIQNNKYMVKPAVDFSKVEYVMIVQLNQDEALEEAEKDEEIENAD